MLLAGLAFFLSQDAESRNVSLVGGAIVQNNSHLMTTSPWLPLLMHNGHVGHFTRFCCGISYNVDMHIYRKTIIKAKDGTSNDLGKPKK